jgi:urease accessory protein
MDRDARKMRGSGPWVFAQATKGLGIPEICEQLLTAWQRATHPDHPQPLPGR